MQKRGLLFMSFSSVSNYGVDAFCLLDGSCFDFVRDEVLFAARGELDVFRQISAETRLRKCPAELLLR